MLTHLVFKALAEALVIGVGVIQAPDPPSLAVHPAVQVMRPPVGLTHGLAPVLQLGKREVSEHEVPPGVADALSRVKEGRDGLRGATGDGGSR